MPPLQLRRPNKNIMTAMSFEVHLWWGIDINENLKMTDIWNIFFSDILSGAIMIRSSSQCHTINTWHRDICELPNVLRKENKHCLKRFEQWIFLLLHVFNSCLTLLHGFEKMAGVQFKAFLQRTKKIVIPWPKMFLLAILCNESWHFRKAPCRRMSVENAQTRPF